MGELGKFWDEHPILTVFFGATAAYLVMETYRATQAEEGGFWNHKYGLYGGPFARHQRMSKMPTPRSTAGTTSTSTTTSSSHNSGMMRNAEDIGETSMSIPIRLHGIPTAIKRRVNHGDYGQDTLPDEYGISGVYERPRALGHVDADAIMGLHGVLPASGGENWL